MYSALVDITWTFLRNNSGKSVKSVSLFEEYDVEAQRVYLLQQLSDEVQYQTFKVDSKITENSFTFSCAKKALIHFNNIGKSSVGYDTREKK